MFCAGQDAYLDSVITHPLQPTFIDRAAGKSLVGAKAAAAKKHFDDDEKCRYNGLRVWLPLVYPVTRLGSAVEGGRVPRNTEGDDVFALPVGGVKAHSEGGDFSSYTSQGPRSP
ncbi:unnamed protein product [Sphagnum balticum]